MTDKVQIIKEEIERRYNCEICYPKDKEASVAAAVLQELLLFIDSLPEEPGCEVNFTTKSEGLNEEISKWRNHYISVLDNNLRIDLRDIEVTANYFAEWQKQQMMKDAVEGTIKYEIGSAEIPQCDKRYQVLSDPVPIANAKLGDKVKIIILKTE